MNRFVNMRQSSGTSSLLPDPNDQPPMNEINGDHEAAVEEATNSNNGLVWMDETPISSITMSVSTLSDSAMDDDDYYDEDVRQGTLMSARMNLLTSMVGGGSLSLPLAYHQMGNICMAPLTMIVIAAGMECSLRCLIISGQITAGSSGSSSLKKGSVTLEQVACAAFGPAAKYCTMALVFFICFFSLVGYGVLLRDLLQPLTDLFHGNFSGNQVMSAVVFFVTPLTTLPSLTALRNVGAASMGSVLLMAICISYRSIQCITTTPSSGSSATDHFSDGHDDSSFFVSLIPHSIEDVLQSLPILLSVFVCHFNVLPVHNELRNPTPERVHNLIRTTYASSTLLYIALGIIGSFYAKCSFPALHSNILKSFSDDDPIILIGRTCLTFAIALAFPMLVVPARNVLLSSMNSNNSKIVPAEPSTDKSQNQSELEEVLLPRDESSNNKNNDCKWKRVLVAVIITWFATAIACCVSSIAVVWDFLGSSLSIMLAFVLPCGSYLKLSSSKEEETTLRMSAWIIVFLSVPIMVIGTSNAVYTTFFHHST